MDTSKLPTPKGMVVAGVMASEAIDSQGEKLMVRGADISDFLEGRGVANYEHRAADQEKIPAAEVVGKIIDAHKVYGEKDCRNTLEMEAWKRIEMPFIWGVVRLYDAAGHPGAVNLAAQIRDANANGDKVTIGFSIEGSTLERGKGNDKHVLEQTVARRVAITFRPCNKTAALTLIADPKAPAGYEKMPGIEGMLDKKEPGPYVRLGQGYENTYSIETMEKALAAGGYNVAPSALTGGASLQRESIRNQVKAAVRDWDKKTPFKKFLKHRLPDVDEGFLDQFADMVHTHTLNKAEALLEKKLAEKKQAKLKVVKPPKPVEPDEEEGEVDDAGPLTIGGQAVKPNPGLKAPHFDEATGTLHTPRGSFPMYIPHRDKPEHKAAFDAAMADPEINKYHDYAMENWIKLHELGKAGKLPEDVVMHATLFSQLSPNTPVPNQELMYGHLVDAMKAKGDPRNPENLAELKKDWLNRDQPQQFPEHSPLHWKRLNDALRIGNDSKLTGRKEGDIGAFMLAQNKFKNISKYHQLHRPLVELLARHKGDVRAAAEELLKHKNQAKLHEAMRARHIKAGKADPGPYLKGPAVAGLAPKTVRYMLGMLGGGNVQVPDTHFSRYLFGLDKGKDSKTIRYIRNNILWNEGNAHILNGIDRYYAQHHDAVKHLQEHPRWGQYFKENPEAAVFPAFWKNWMAIVPHEKARGMKTGGFNEYTDHRPFFEAANSIMKAEIEEGDDSLPTRTAKIHAQWRQEHGDMPAMLMYLRYLVPQLMAHAHRRAAVKIKEELSKAVPKSVLGVKGRAEPIQFQGQSVVPGHLRHQGVDYHALGSTPEFWLARELTDGDPTKGEVKKIPREDNVWVGSYPHAVDAPTVIDADKHGVGDLNSRPEQRALIHGMDLDPKKGKSFGGTTAQGGQSYWHRGANGKRVFVKGGDEGEPYREGLYYNLAHSVFGLGHYLSPTAVVRHPQTGAEVAVIQHVPGTHVDDKEPNAEQHKNLDVAHQSGDLQKLGLMNHILGNHDRNWGNYLHRKGGGLTLIDHGFAFSSEPYMDTLHKPAYMEHHGWDTHLQPLHPDTAKWLHGLSEQDLEMEMKRHGAPADVIRHAVGRLRGTKQSHLQNPHEAFKTMRRIAL